MEKIIKEEIRMKLTLHKRTKKYIIGALVIAFCFTGYHVYRALDDEKISIEEKTIFEYSCRSTIDYKVALHPNELYPDNILGEDGHYSKRLMDYIGAEFNLEYTSSEPTPIKGEYQVVARVNGYQGQTTSKSVYWSKSFPLTKLVTISQEGTSIGLKEKVNFDLKEYDSFCVMAKEMTGMNVSNEVIVELVGSISIDRDGQSIPIDFSPYIRIPLLEDVFQIEKGAGEPVESVITEKIETIVPYNRTKVSLLVVSMLILLTAMSIFAFLVKEPDEFAMLRKKNKGLLKNYGSRMVAMHEMPDFRFNRYFQVHSMKDMIKISDEVQKPIIYVPDDSIALRNSEIYIIDENNLYRWNSA